jgi:hypothetical protein
LTEEKAPFIVGIPDHAQQARWKSETKFFNANMHQPGDNKVTELMYQDDPGEDNNKYDPTKHGCVHSLPHNIKLSLP